MGSQSDLFHHRSVLGSFEQLDRMTRHDCGYSVLIDELGVAVPPQQHTKIVEPGDHTLEFDPVHQKDCERCLVLTHMIEEGILKILRAVGRHCLCFHYSLAALSCARRVCTVPGRPNSPAWTLAQALDGTRRTSASPS